MAALLSDSLDAAARARLVDRFGAGVGPWCDALPELVARLAQRWNLTVREERPGNTGRTLLCDSPDGPRVLKLCPDPGIAQAEATALQAWAGLPRVVQLLDTDLGAGAILLEGLVPGTTLTGADVPWDQVRDLLGRLHGVAADGPFPTQLERVHTMFDLAERRLRGSTAEAHLPVDVLHAGRTCAETLATTGPVALVHGDLHPGNVLDAGPARGIVAIDPRPCVGDPAFDGVDWAFVPLADGGTLADGLAELPDPGRTRAWCVALAPLIAMGPLRRAGPTSFTDSVLTLLR
ncbi:aminoglycoside phosphotransferase family protein [Amycolatopsis carbonis]|uniref:Aminoglycoside phosphotransferase family protein n=1 Tax=Amycolatopsis carbonis TaxID=715471 RepID=A0A9Y2N2M0_9PSEU|nr:phosphotransferase [Amycolatopsis sp. 2-15]WIX84099.1 aminoglycoside phosphotransferase family protein [Amycolatopsis sp. 2-15]